MNFQMHTSPSRLSAISLAFLFSLGAQAADVTSTFNDGDTLTATQMTEIKDAVNSKQNRVTGTCPVGESIRVINADGTVACEVDTDTNTTYTAGAGISIVGTTISARVGADIVVNPAFTFIAQGDTAVTQVASVTVSAPSAGFVLVTHTGNVVMFNTPNTIDIGIGDTNSSIDTDVTLGTLDVTSTLTTDRYQIPYSVQNLYTVNAAGNFTYYGLAQKNTTFDAGGFSVVPQAITTIFIPNRY